MGYGSFGVNVNIIIPETVSDVGIRGEEPSRAPEERPQTLGIRKQGGREKKKANKFRPLSGL